MTNLVEFPGLGIELEVPRVAFTIFGLPIYWYGICIGVGVALALVFAFSQSKLFGLDADKLVDVVMFGLVGGVVGARLYYVIFNEYTSFQQILDIRDGGLGIYGGIIGGCLCGVLACKWRKVPVLPLLDLAGMGFLIGQACGRWGNFFNQEAFGTNTTLPWGMISPTTTEYLLWQQSSLASQGITVDPFLPVHPTFLYESLWCALGFALLFLYRKHRRFNGELFVMYLAWYGLGRFFIESLRTDALYTPLFHLRVSMVVAAVTVLAAVAIWTVARYKTKGQPLRVPEVPPHTKTVRVKNEEGISSVVISWPANEKAPSKQEQQRMVEDALAVLKTAIPVDAPAEGADKKDAISLHHHADEQSDEDKAD